MGFDFDFDFVRWIVPLQLYLGQSLIKLRVALPLHLQIMATVLKPL